MGNPVFPSTRVAAKKEDTTYSSEENRCAKFPSRLRQLRKEYGVSQATLAKELGVSKSTIGLWETGDTLPDARMIHGIALYYGVSSDFILCLSDVMSQEKDVKDVCAYTKLDELAVKALPKFEIHAFINGLFANGLEKELFSVHRWIKKSAGRSVRRNSLLDQLKSVSNGGNAMDDLQELEPQEDWYIEQACEKLKCVESSIRQMYEAEKRFQQAAEENTERRMGVNDDAAQE